MNIKNLASLSAVLSLSLLSAAEPGLLLSSNFDKYNTTPEFHASKTMRVGGIAPDLQLRMFPNIKGNGNSVCLNNKERITYTQPGNFRPDCGTVSLWVNLQNWNLSDMQYFHSFFEVSSAASKYRMVIYKYRNHNNKITFYLQSAGKSCVVTASTKGWKKDTWHKIDAVWDQKEIKLYVDAQLVSTNQSRKLPPGMVLPETIKGTFIGLNSQAGWKHNPAWITAYDELKIYDRCLSGEEIVKAYDKYFPRNFEANLKPGSAHIPPAPHPVKIDGTLDKNEWANATVIPMLNHMYVSQSHHAVAAEVMLQYDKQNLYAAFRVKSPAFRKRVVKKDGELWNDDSVEFHTTGTDGKKRHFILNANGAIYDALDGKANWESGAKAAGNATADSWWVETAIPLSALGKIDRYTRIKANFGSNNWKAHTNYHTWNYVFGYLKGYGSPEFFGDIVFGDKNDAVQFVDWGNPAQSALELRLKGKPGMKASASYLAETGAEAKCNIDLLKKTWTVDLPTCRNIIRVSVKNSAGKEIYRTENFVLVQQPLNMTYSARASKHLLLIDLSVNKAAASEKKGNLYLKDSAGKILARKEFLMTKENIQLEFPLPRNLKENSSYTIEAVLGKFSRKAILRIPDMTPFKTRVGIDNSIPTPWKPVVVNGKRYTAGNRVYVFDRGPLPSAITVDGKPVVTGSPRLTVNGREVQWQPIIPGKNYGDHAEFTAEGSCGTLKFACRGEVWFDGMYRWDFSMTPASAFDFKSMQLCWNMPADAAKYILNPYYVPWKNNRADLKWSVDERNSIVWLTGTARGLAWWCQSDANWISDVNANQVFLKQNGKTASVRIEIIQKPAKLTKKASYTMVFQATPPRKSTTDYRKLQFHAWRAKGTNCGISGWNTAYGIKDASNILHYTTLIPAHPEEYKKHYTKWKKQGVLDLAYSMPAHIGRLSPEYDLFYPEWAVTPGIKWGAKDEFTGEKFYTEPCCARTKGGDLQAYRADKLFRETPDLGGIYFDICHVQSCDNALHGCGGVDAFGKKIRSSTALALREYFMRIYKITRKHNRALWLHAHNAYYPFVHDFADLWLPGEEQYFPLLRNPDKHYLTGISKEEYQSALNPTIRGVGIMMIAQNARVLGGSPELQKQKERFIGKKAIDKVKMALYLYDINLMAFRSGIESTTLFPFWETRNKINIADADFHGYWIDPVVSVNVPNVLVSWYSWKKPAPYSRLLVVGNLNGKEIPFSLKIDWKKLGVSPDAKWFDPLTGKELNKNQLSVAAENFLLIAIK